MDKPSPLPAHARFPRHPQRGVLCAKPFAPCSCPATLAAPSPSITPSPRSSVFPRSACSSVSHGDTGHHSPASPGPPTHLQPPAATSVPSVPSETILQIWRDVGATVPVFAQGHGGPKTAQRGCDYKSCPSVERDSGGLSGAWDSAFPSGFSCCSMGHGLRSHL